MKKSEWAIGLLYLGLLALLATVGQMARRHGDPTCAYDGGKIDRQYSVRLVDGSGKDVVCCCIACAEAWARRNGNGLRAVFVVDETSGTEVEAAAAFFVRSLVITNRTTGNRIHAFLTERDAERHVRSFGGSLLVTVERPFANLPRLE